MKQEILKNMKKAKKLILSQPSNLEASESEELGINLEWPYRLFFIYLIAKQTHNQYIYRTIKDLKTNKHEKRYVYTYSTFPFT